MSKNNGFADIKVAIVDLYNNEPNEGMRCIKDIVENCSDHLEGQKMPYKVYETRYKAEVPDLSYDIYISTGGPGSPFEGEGQLWEKRYFELLDRIWNHNQKNQQKKYVFFICHSFQMMCRFFELAEINKRRHRSFGIIPIVKTPEGNRDPLLRLLPEPYFAADFRQWEVINPDESRLKALSAAILSRERDRIDPALPKALMAIRLSDELVGTQYHPEANPDSMMVHFRQPERREQVVEEYGEKRYNDMLTLLDRPEAIRLTREMILPRFLMNAAGNLNRLRN